MKQLSFVILMGLATLVANISYAQSNPSPSVAAIEKKLRANNWDLIGQAYAERYDQDSRFVMQAISVAAKEYDNPNFIDAFVFPNNLEVYYELFNTLTVQTPEGEEVVELPWQLSFHIVKYELVETEEGIELRLFTVVDKPDTYRIFGIVEFVENQLRLVQSFGNQQLIWVFEKTEYQW